MTWRNHVTYWKLEKHDRAYLYIARSHNGHTYTLSRKALRRFLLVAGNSIKVKP